MKKKLKAGDEVLVIAGSDKGRRGAVLGFSSSGQKLRVKNVRLQTCYDKKEGIQKREGLIDRSNVKLIQSKSEDSKKSPANVKPQV